MRDALARARLAHHGQRLAGEHVEVDATHRRCRPFGRGEGDAQVAHTQDGFRSRPVGRVGHRPESFTSKRSRNASPTKLNDTTTSRMAMPGRGRDPPLVEVRRALGDHRAPLGRRRTGAEADEAERRGEQHDLPEVHRGVHEHRRVRHRQDVAAEHQPSRRADGLGRLDVLALSHGDDLGAQQIGRRSATTPAPSRSARS